MPKKVKRKITGLNESYYWVLDGNTIDGGKETHIRIHSKQITKSILYLVPYAWHFEVKPKTIKQAIQFALGNGWNPNEKGTEITLSMNEEGGFFVSTS